MSKNIHSENIHSDNTPPKKGRLPESAASMEPTGRENGNVQNGSQSNNQSNGQNGAQTVAYSASQNDLQNGADLTEQATEQIINEQAARTQDSEQGRYRGAAYPMGRDREIAAAIVQERATNPSDELEPVERVYRGVRYQAGGERYAPEKIRVTKENDIGLIQWFSDRRVANKQLPGLPASKMLSVLGVIGVSLILLTIAGRRQLLDRAVSELSATATAFDAGSTEGSASDGVLLEAAEEIAEFGDLGEALQQDVRIALQTRVELNQLEYVALVGPEFRVIAHNTSDRSGELLNPNNLVSSALRQRQPKAAVSLQTIAELQQLGIAVPSEANEAALIQYTVTPIFAGGTPTDKSGVRNPEIGALVTGDILDGESVAITNALTGFSDGYSEIYIQEPSGSFDLVARSQAGEITTSPGVGVNFDFLEQTIRRANAGQTDVIVGERFKPLSNSGQRDNRDRYTVAATAIADSNGKAIGVIQRGLSEAELRRWRAHAMAVLLGTALLALLADVIIAKLLGRSIARPLRNLQEATEKFASGDRTARADVFSRDEVGRVASAFNELAAAVSTSESSLRFQSETQSESARRARTLSALTSDIRKTLEEEAIFNTSVERAREVLDVDRVLIYRFNSTFTGGVATAESIGKGWSRAKGQTLEDPMLPDSVDRFMGGQVSTVENIETEDLTECHCRLLRELEVKANMVAPVVVGDELVALLCAHQCSGPRQWQPEEINMIQQIATQIGYALSQAKLLDAQKQAVKQEQQLSGLVSSIRETDNREKIFRTVTRQVKLALDTSRVIIYLFDKDWKGIVVAESVDSQWTPALGEEIADPCFADRYVEQYRTGKVKATTDIYNAGLTDCHLGQLAPFEVKANLVAPIVVEEKLLGLLIAHECTGPRSWTDISINFIQRAATQLGFALEQAEANRLKESAMTETQEMALERMQRQERLQTQLVNLLSDVEAAADGDLTVRADVTASEIGTVADFFNAIVGNLQEIVTQVKLSALQVNDSLGQNEGAIRVLAEESEQQKQQTLRTMESVGMMMLSIEQVAQQAEEAAAVAKSASQTATLGGEAMDLTVNNIMSLRQIVGKTAKKVKRLGESSQQITKAVSLINQISQQTNLLAINAGIEAARAGEDGQGFAAVAEEVSELASRSATATEEIERIVNAIQRETGDVVEAIEQSTAQVVEGTRRVEDAKASLTQILSGSQKMDELARQISTATSSQVATSANVSTLMEEIAQLAERTSASSQQVSAALDQTMGVARDLQSQVSTFVVEKDQPESQPEEAGETNGR
ncbi:MAG: GAF domain-containing protein [Phormidesmis sp.]